MAIYAKWCGASLAVNIIPLTAELFPAWLSQQPAAVQNWLASVQFQAKPEQVAMLPDSNGKLQQVLVGVSRDNSLWSLAVLPNMLPSADYQIHDPHKIVELEQAALGWGLAFYQFTRYKKSSRTEQPVLLLSEAMLEKVERLRETISWVRDLINTPTEDMGPENLAKQVRHLAKAYNAEYLEIVGDALLQANFPAIHIVGRASSQAPRLCELRWGAEHNPKITLVGKGVCFDSGGLNIKPANAMATMKKDMGGAAQVLGLAKLIMASNLPVRLRVLIPAVENAVSANAFRPGDIVKTRKGLSVEVGNTDAEGRVILSDALAEAVTEQPELLIDFATLTGAARVALGGEVPALFGNCDAVINELKLHCQKQSDPLWHMPLYKPYHKYIESKIADLSNDSSTTLGGAITAALFLQNFVDDTPWLHIDLSAWNYGSRAGRPEGGEAMGIRAVFAYFQQRFGR